MMNTFLMRNFSRNFNCYGKTLKTLGPRLLKFYAAKDTSLIHFTPMLTF